MKPRRKPTPPTRRRGDGTPAGADGGALSSDEVMRKLRIKPNKLRAMIKHGDLRCDKVRGVLRFPLAELHRVFPVTFPS